MHTHLVFQNVNLIDLDADDGNPAGAKLAHLIADALPEHGFATKSVVQEDWGWAIVIDNRAFPLWIGCGPDLEHESGHLCFIEPSRAQVRRWFKRVDTTDIIRRLGAALEAIVASEAATTGVRWWSEDEVRQR